MSQTAAIFVDAYRELNSKKMFWITMILNGVIVLAFAAVGISEKGLSILWFHFEAPFNTNIVTRPIFYKFLFSDIAVSWWLNWLGIILALVSTAGIMPDFVAGGTVDLYLSKPISRVRLYLLKYVSGLLFVTLQVLVFASACFVVIGIRGTVWDWRVFYAIPVVLLVFSYLYCVCALLGLLTRSTVASLLLTILFWFFVFGVHFTEQTTLMSKIAGDFEEEGYAYRFSQYDKQIQALQKRVSEGEESLRNDLREAQEGRKKLEEKKRRTDPSRRNVKTVHDIFYRAKTILPKTTETSLLLTRWMEIDETGMNEARITRREERKARNGWFSGFKDPTEVSLNDPQVLREMPVVLMERSVGWVLGTSLIFEAVMLLIGLWIFCRRDY